jgi:hypothetical protein
VNSGNLKKEINTCIEKLKVIYQKSNGITMSSDYCFDNIDAEYEKGIGVTFKVLYVKGFQIEGSNQDHSPALINNIDAFPLDARSKAKYFLSEFAIILESPDDDEKVIIKLQKNLLAIFNIERNERGQINKSISHLDT